MNRIAIIPARGGSKRIPRKNIRPFLGKPIIAYSIEAALDSGLFDEVMVSTDDSEVAQIAKEYGAIVPFFRTTENSNDHATLADVLIEVIDVYLKKDVRFNQFACILPTSPFISKEKLVEGFSLMDKEGYSSVFPVLRYSYPIKRALKLDEDTGCISMIWPEYLKTRSQDLAPSFHDSGQFYCVNVEGFIKEKTLFTEKSGIIELSELEVQDIDTLEDWRVAEMKFRLVQELQNG